MEVFKNVLKVGLLAILILLVVKLVLYTVIAVLLDFILFLFGVTFSYKLYWAIVVVMESLRFLFHKRNDDK